MSCVFRSAMPAKGMDHVKYLFLLTALLLCSLSRCWASAPIPSVAVILDTDMASDVDDVGALHVLNYYQKACTCNILAIIVDQKEAGSPDACKAIDQYWRHSTIPVGQVTGDGCLSDPSAYSYNLQNSYIGTVPSTLDSTVLYRKTLASQKDGSVTILCIGHETAFARLLKSPPDQYSPLTGSALIAKKVSRVVVMGGDYSPNVGESFTPAQPEFNFATDAESSAAMVSQLTRLRIPTYYIGFTMGSAIQIGGWTEALPFNSPLREAYRLYNGSRPRAGWDVLAAQFAVDGPTDKFALTRGTNTVDASTGLNHFTVNSSGTQYYLTLTYVPAIETDFINALYQKLP